MKKVAVLSIIVVTATIIGWYGYKSYKIRNWKYPIPWGTAIDSLNGVKVFYNGPVATVEGRNKTDDGYNLGLKYQCVEFVKRYYYEYYQHKMPDSYGHALEFYDQNLVDKAYNAKRDLTQFSNPSIARPQIGDIVVFNKTIGNPYGHVAIISDVDSQQITIIQQNPGPYASSRAKYDLTYNNGKYYIENNRLLGWLRKEKN